jgi:hypothetical protein
MEAWERLTNNTLYPSGNELHKLRVRRMLRLDEDRAGRHNCRNSLESRRAHRFARLHEIHNAICDTERARSFDAATNVFDIGLEFRLRRAVHDTGLLVLEAPEVLFSEVREARDDVLANQVFGLGQAALGWDLYLERALAEAEIEDFFNARGGCGRDDALMFGDLVAPGYA